MLFIYLVSVRSRSGLGLLELRFLSNNSGGFPLPIQEESKGLGCWPSHLDLLGLLSFTLSCTGTVLLFSKSVLLRGAILLLRLAKVGLPGELC